ncbi:site-specific integrase [Sinorhizobium sp. 8-89]|uniref:site-specific integrase n=1 Tax=Sinorhizobium sp. 7-81 TaxID=3049087 RepID=UPI0024C2ED7A|nr:site-specific integrase [Sinorhizobium sp. 7-81]MDK1386403.1 site-specific integrase [Sinorhizobium sp. 7-81]
MGSDDISRYVVKHPASGIYRYYRRVPTEVAHLDQRTHVKQSLKTKSLKEALEKAQSVHDAAENFWRALLVGNDNETAFARYESAVKVAQSMGFTYKSAEEVAALPLDELEQRLLIVGENMDKAQIVVDAVAGTVEEPAPRLSNVWSLYEKHNAAGLTGMSKNQLRKHKVSRERAISYAIDVMGDLELPAITRPDVLKFRKWWTEKVISEGLKADTANRSFSDLMGMLTPIDNALHTNYHEVWEKARIKETNATKGSSRPPFPLEWISDKILAPGAMDMLDEDARLIVYAMVETGARLGEICNLRPQDIRLEDEVPHIEVAERTDRRQKSEYSIRRVPLVGISLWAMRQRPQGFAKYQDKSDSASALINKVMRNNGLMPTDDHSIYSMRHSFQDRIENAGCSDRMQADLMGHEFGRPKYGDGPEMKRRQKFLEGIMFAWLQPVTIGATLAG